jgi:hypothetical protein
MNIYSIEGTGEEYEFESAEAPYVLMPYQKPTAEHICESGQWVLSYELRAKSAALAYLADTFYFTTVDDAPADILAARVFVSATL